MATSTEGKTTADALDGKALGLANFHDIQAHIRGHGNEMDPAVAVFDVEMDHYVLHGIVHELAKIWI